MKICIIIPRFYENISGGAEKEASSYAKILSEDNHVTVLTTTAKSYITWENVLKPGIFGKNPLVIRFDSNKKRKIKKFNQISNKIFKQDFISEEEEENWLINQGPENTKIVNYLKDNKLKFDCYIFFSYLYYPIVKGIPFVKNKAIIVPTLHDEKFAYMKQYRKLFTDELVYAFNAQEEVKLFEHIYGFIPQSHEVIGMYIENKSFELLPVNFKNYFVAIGRIDSGKGFGMLIDLFRDWNKIQNNKYTLILIGESSIKIPQNDNIVATGFLDEETKQNYILKSLALLNPSAVESFSIVIMEAWLRKRPVVVNSKSDVMVGHCQRSNGGLWFSDKDSFMAVMDYIINHSEESKQMGENGFKYVIENYNYTIVKNRLNRLAKIVKKINHS